MSENPCRRRVTYSQLENLWEILNQNRALVTGYNKSAQGRENAQRMWRSVERSLNSHGDGAVKDWKGWCKYWNDYKSKLKGKVASLRASYGRTGGGQADTRPLNELEEKFLQILGEGFGLGLSGIRVEPFEEAIVEIENINPVTVGDTPRTDDTYCESVLQEHPIQSFTPASPQPGPSILPQVAPQTPPASVTSTEAAPAPVPTGTRTPPPHTPRLSPRRRRRAPRRREAPLTQDMARRILIQISERREAIEQRNSNLLEEFVQELREIKNILNSRLPLPPRDAE